MHGLKSRKFLELRHPDFDRWFETHSGGKLGRSVRAESLDKKIIGLSKIRWVVEQAIAHLHQFKRLAVRWDRLLFMHEGFTRFAVSLICWRRLNHVLLPELTGSGFSTG